MNTYVDYRDDKYYRLQAFATGTRLEGHVQCYSCKERRCPGNETPLRKVDSEREYGSADCKNLAIISKWIQ